MQNQDISILIIYTGGTIGMVNDPETGSLVPFNFESIESQVPELKRFGFKLTTIAFEPLVDSSNISPAVWVRLAETIKENYESYDGFVILHGTDTMAYSASALSFMLENLSKPVVFTGSQLPIGTIRTDGKENLITAIEIAAAQKDGKPTVPEVSLCFENKLFRGNRTTKSNVEEFNAFSSYNYPALAEIGIHINYNYKEINYPSGDDELKISTKLDTNVFVLKLFPGISQIAIDAVLNIKGLKGLILETYGAGNAFTDRWFIEAIRKVIEKGVVVLNVTQCREGSVDMGRYETSLDLINAGVVSGYDITTEAAITKLMYLFGKELSLVDTVSLLKRSISGEINI